MIGVLWLYTDAVGCAIGVPKNRAGLLVIPRAYNADEPSDSTQSGTSTPQIALPDPMQSLVDAEQGSDERTPLLKMVHDPLAKEHAQSSGR